MLFLLTLEILSGFFVWFQIQSIGLPSKYTIRINRPSIYSFRFMDAAFYSSLFPLGSRLPKEIRAQSTATMYVCMRYKYGRDEIKSSTESIAMRERECTQIRNRSRIDNYVCSQKLPSAKPYSERTKKRAKRKSRYLLYKMLQIRNRLK